MPAEKIIMQTELPPHKPQDAEWSREMKGKKQLTSVGLANWVVVFPKKDQVPAKNLVSALQRVCPGLGMTVRVAIIGPVISEAACAKRRSGRKY